MSFMDSIRETHRIKNSGNRSRCSATMKFMVTVINFSPFCVNRNSSPCSPIGMNSVRSAASLDIAAGCPGRPRVRFQYSAISPGVPKSFSRCSRDRPSRSQGSSRWGRMTSKLLQVGVCLLGLTIQVWSEACFFILHEGIWILLLGLYEDYSGLGVLVVKVFRPATLSITGTFTVWTGT